MAMEQIPSKPESDRRQARLDPGGRFPAQNDAQGALFRDMLTEVGALRQEVTELRAGSAWP